MTGAKVNVFIGKPGNAELLFTVWQKLATNFAVTWQRQLIEKHAGALYLPDSPKAPIKYIVEWMSAGGMQSTAKGCIPYPKDNLINLLCLNRLATYLEVDQLKKETLESIDLFTQYQRVDLKLLDQLSKTAHWTSESRPVVRTNVKKLIGGRIEQTWSAEAEEYPGRFKGALSLLGILGKEVAQEKEARRQAKVSHAKPTGVGLPGARKTPPKRRVANDKGPQNGGPNASKDANKVTTGVKDEAGSQPAPMPRVSVNATGGTMGQSSKVAKASPVCFNCGQVGYISILPPALTIANREIVILDLTAPILVCSSANAISVLNRATVQFNALQRRQPRRKRSRRVCRKVRRAISFTRTTTLSLRRM